MIVNKSVLIEINEFNKKYYDRKGYKANVGQLCEIKIEDLKYKYMGYIDVRCESCLEVRSMIYYYYMKLNKKLINGELHSCRKCAISKRRKTNLEKYGHEYPIIDINSKVYSKNKDTLMSKYGVDNISKLEWVKEKKIETSLANYGTKHTLQSEIIKDKIKNTCLEKYGVDNPTKLREFFLKAQKNAFKKHEFGDLIYQGTYELDFINLCLDMNIIIENGKEFKYDTDRTYYSDFYIPSINLICEIKSTWTYNCDIKENLRKKQSVIESGYSFIFIIDKKYDELIELLNFNI